MSECYENHKLGKLITIFCPEKRSPEKTSFKSSFSALNMIKINIRIRQLKLLEIQITGTLNRLNPLDVYTQYQRQYITTVI